MGVGSVQEGDLGHEGEGRGREGGVRGGIGCVLWVKASNAQGAELAKPLGCADARERDQPITVIIPDHLPTRRSLRKPVIRAYPKPAGMKVRLFGFNLCVMPAKSL